MVRRIFGMIIALLGLAFIGFAAGELWDALTGGFDYTGVTARVIAMAGFDYVGPISIVSVSFVGGLVFVVGCIVMTPQEKTNGPDQPARHA